MSQDQPTFSHSGQRYLLGYTLAEYAIWDRQAPGPPIRKFPKSDDGWNEAWSTYQTLEAPPSPAPEPTVAPPAAAPPAAAAHAVSPATSSPAAPTTPIPSAAPAAGPARGPGLPPMSGRLLATALTFAGWALLVLFPLAGIAAMTVGGGFYAISQGLAYLAFGPALWAICLTLAKVAERNG